MTVAQATDQEQIEANTIQAIKLYEDALYDDHSSRIRPSETTILNIVRQGVDPNKIGPNEYGYTLLHFAAKYGHAAVFESLIDQGANINLVSRDNTPSLLIAAACEHKVGEYNNRRREWTYDNSEYCSIVRMLIANGANVLSTLASTKDIYIKKFLEPEIIELIKAHTEEWFPKLQNLKLGDYSDVKTARDVYHLASVSKPGWNAVDVKTCVKTIFSDLLPPLPKFDALYKEIFNETRPPSLKKFYSPEFLAMMKELRLSSQDFLADNSSSAIQREGLQKSIDNPAFMEMHRRCGLPREALYDEGWKPLRDALIADPKAIERVVAFGEVPPTEVKRYLARIITSPEMADALLQKEAAGGGKRGTTFWENTFAFIKACVPFVDSNVASTNRAQGGGRSKEKGAEV